MNIWPLKGAATVYLSVKACGTTRRDSVSRHQEGAWLVATLLHTNVNIYALLS
ncbi:MAG: hypothetical protein AVDCRST_MAG86-4123 [uncultured Truepera sp.]|uniref:Uncharacterized protein n=1 Tax=uncultured Truepera sp. TaxID=543023 RepID=A0A6J4VYS3_9DEIN|nr:MAG: hypothetical protein AVDCRST_MAG86-4123 [uncultured Truepera sp.]